MNGKVNGKVRITTQRPKAPQPQSHNHIIILSISPMPIPIMNNGPKNFAIVEIEKSISNPNNISYAMLIKLIKSDMRTGIYNAKVIAPPKNVQIGIINV